MKFVLTTIFFLMISFAQAATYRPIGLEKLVEESDAGLEVKLIKKNSFMNNMGMIYTDHYFEIHDSAGLSVDSYLENNLFKLTMTGGTVGNLTSYIDGAPTFELNEKAFLLVRFINSKAYISNLSLGKYKIDESQNGTVYVSTVFPYDLSIGQVEKEKMFKLIKEKPSIEKMKQKDEQENRAPNSVVQNYKNKSSTNDDLKRKPSSNENMLYLTEILISFAGIFLIFIFGKLYKKNE